MIRTDERRKKVIHLATTNSHISVRQVAARLDVSHWIAYKDLATLVKAGKLVKRGFGINTYYTRTDPPSKDPPGKAA